MTSQPQVPVAAPTPKPRSRFTLALALLCAVFVVALHGIDRRLQAETWERNSARLIDLAANRATNEFDALLADTRLLGRYPTDDPGLPHLLRRVLEAQPDTFQARWIGADGVERLRFDRRGDAILQRSDADLQDKSSRPYVKRGLAVEGSAVALSRIDLNVEQGQVERPLRPTVRAMTPAYRSDGAGDGVYVINASAQHLLEMLTNLEANTPMQFGLASPEDVWIYHADPARCWGDQLGHDALASGVGEVEGVRWTEAELSNLRRVQWGRDRPHRLVAFVARDVVFADAQRRLWMMLAGAGVVVLLGGVAERLWERRGFRLRAERRRAEVYAKILEQTEDMVYVTDLGGRILYANPAVERVTGYAPEEVVGQTPALFNSGEHTPALHEALWQRVLAGESFTVTMINQRKDGSQFHEAKTIFPLRDDAEEVTHLVSVGRDCSLEVELPQRDMSRASRMAGAIAHHYNNLLSVILGFTDLAQSAIASGRVGSIERYLDRTLQATTRAQELTAKIQLAASRPVDITRRFDVGKLVRGVVGVLEVPEGLTVEVEVDGEQLVGGEGSLFQEAVSALVRNAVVAVEGAGVVRITVARRTLEGPCPLCAESLNGEWVCVEVCDDGPGIDAEELELVFEPFFSGKAADASVAMTPGLGLTYVREIAHAHHGHVQVRSVVGEGATFVLVLPPLPEGA